MPAFTMGYRHTAAEKRLFSIKNVVINLDSATIKWNGQFTNYNGKNRQGLKANTFSIFSVDSMILLRQKTFKVKRESGQQWNTYFCLVWTV